MNLSLYQDTGSLLHRLDPRTKLAGMAAAFALALTFNDPLFLVPVTTLVVLLFAAAKAFRVLLTLRYILALLFAFSLVLWPFFISGPTPLFEVGFLKVSRESLLYGLAMGLRLATFVMAGLLLLATTRNEDINAALIAAGLPYPAAFAVATALRLVPTFAGAGGAIIQAQVSRGLDLESGGMLSRFGKFLPLAVPMFISALRYTNFLAMALESKGFRPNAPRTAWHRMSLTAADGAVLAGMIVVLAVALGVRLYLGLGAVIPGRL